MSPKGRGGASALLAGLCLAITAPAGALAQSDDAVSREISVYNDVQDNTGFTDAVSREISVYNDVQDNTGFTDAVSREASVFNDLDGVDPDMDGVLTDDGDGTSDPCPTGQMIGCDDNCPFDYNPDQTDTDGNGVGDLCDPLRVIEVRPEEDTLDAPEATNVSVRFSEPISPASVTTSSLRLLDDTGTPVLASVGVAPSNLRAVLDPDDPLDLDALYTVEVTSGVLDVLGNPAAPFTSLFRTTPVATGSRTLPVAGEESEGLGALSRTGSAVAGAGDLDHDGTNDWLVGAPSYGSGGAVEGGAAAVYLGSTVAADRASADIIFEGAADHERAGVAVAGDLDFDGDGTNDILIGAEEWNRSPDPDIDCSSGATPPAPCGPGRVYLIYFDPADYPNIGDPTMPDVVSLADVGTAIPGVVFLGSNVGDRAGAALAGGGFLDADTAQDLLIGAPGRDWESGRNDAGAVYGIFDAPLSGVVSLDDVACTHRTIGPCAGMDEEEGIVIRGTTAGDALGFSVAFLGDVVGASPLTVSAGDDLGAGAPGDDEGDTDAGSMTLGDAGDFDTSIIEVDEFGDTRSGARLVGDQAGENLGWIVAPGGDGDGDGSQDVLAGAPAYTVNLLGDAGRVIQLQQPLSDGTFFASQVGSTLDGTVWTGDAAGDRLGESAAGVDDVTGDGLDDLVLGAPYVDPIVDSILRTDAGAIYLVEGVPGGLGGTESVGDVGDSVAGERLSGAQDGELAGSAVAGTGDIDADGDPDFVVGAPGADVGGDMDEGLVYLVLESEPEPAGDCGPEGCTVAHLPTGAQLAVPAGSLGSAAVLDVTGLDDPAFLPAPEPAGLALLAGARFEPEGQAFASPYPLADLPVRGVYEDDVSGGESFDVFRYDAGLDDWVDTALDGTVTANPHYPAPAAAVGFELTAQDLRVFATFVADCERDGEPDAVDPDDDNDGILDGSDNCPCVWNTPQTDCDVDGTGDACDPDTVDGDGDGVDDGCDNCAATPNEDQLDSDGDGTGDVCDVCPFDPDDDGDGDGLCCDVDNCCGVANPSQTDGDGDGVGDACDTNPVLRVSSDPADMPDFAAIQAAVDGAVQSGTRILILPGTGPYTENVTVNRGMQLFLIGDDGDSTAEVVVDGGTGTAVEVFSTAGGAPVVLKDLTLSGDTGLVASVKTEVRDAVFRDIAFLALDLDGGTHDLETVTVDGSTGTGVTLGLQVATDTAVSMRLSSLVDVTGTAVTVYGSADLENVLIAGADEGIVLGDPTATLDLRHATVAGHEAVGIDSTAGGTVTVSRSILAGSLDDMLGVACGSVSWSVVESLDCTSANQNLTGAPLFVGGGDWHLQSGSPALDHGPDPTLFTGEPCRDLDGEPRQLDHDGDGFAEGDPGCFEHRNTVLVPGEVTGLTWTNDTTLTWTAEPSAGEYHVYRDDVDALSYESFGVCRDDLDPVRTDTTLTDTELPTPGEAFSYLITADAGLEEGTLDDATCTERTNVAPCL